MSLPDRADPDRYFAREERIADKWRAEAMRLRALLHEIAYADPVDMALDPGWAARVAKRAFDEEQR